MTTHEQAKAALQEAFVAWRETRLVWEEAKIAWQLETAAAWQEAYTAWIKAGGGQIQLSWNEPEITSQGVVITWAEIPWEEEVRDDNSP